jgi:hypothetical protein
MRETTDIPIPPPRIRELHHRDEDGVDVRLLWSEGDGAVSVAVFDSTTGDAFTVDVRDGDRALDVFAHPFAYAAWRGIDTSGVDTAPVLRALRASFPGRA